MIEVHFSFRASTITLAGAFCYSSFQDPFLRLRLDFVRVRDGLVPKLKLKTRCQGTELLGSGEVTAETLTRTPTGSCPGHPMRLR